MTTLDGIEPIRDQLVALVRKRIASGEYPPGSKLPTARELAEECDTSARTVTDAYRILRESGEVIGVRGRGVFVAPEQRGD